MVLLLGVISMLIIGVINSINSTVKKVKSEDAVMRPH